LVKAQSRSGDRGPRGSGYLEADERDLVWGRIEPHLGGLAVLLRRVSLVHVGIGDAREREGGRSCGRGEGECPGHTEQRKAEQRRDP
jgi:hypothetical protein